MDTSYDKTSYSQNSPLYNANVIAVWTKRWSTELQKRKSVFGNNMVFSAHSVLLNAVLLPFVTDLFWLRTVIVYARATVNGRGVELSFRILLRHILKRKL